jgi:hypothetical protein
MAYGSPEFSLSEPSITVEAGVTVFRISDGGSPPRFAVVEMGNYQEDETHVPLEGYGPFTEEECFNAWPQNPQDESEEQRSQALENIAYPQRHIQAKLPATDRPNVAENIPPLAAFILGKTSYGR